MAKRTKLTFERIPCDDNHIILRADGAASFEVIIGKAGNVLVYGYGKEWPREDANPDLTVDEPVGEWQEEAVTN